MHEMVPMSDDDEPLPGESDKVDLMSQNGDDSNDYLMAQSRRRVMLSSFITIVITIAFTIEVFTTPNSNSNSDSNSPSTSTTLDPKLILPASSTTLTRIAFGSCSDQTRPLPYFDTIHSFAPNLFLLLGDNVYGDCTSLDCVELVTAYKDLSEHPSFQGFDLPIIAAIDDHDAGIQDADKNNPYLEKSEQLFLDFWVPDGEDPRRFRPGLYTSHTFGEDGNRVKVIVLDNRTFKDEFLITDQWGAPGKERYIVDYDSSKSMLGAAQWAWLAKELDDESIDLQIVMSSLQVLNSNTGFEAWRLFDHERTRLTSLLKMSGIPSLIVSGDRHVGGVYKDENLLEVTSSSFTHTEPLGAFGVTSDEIDESRITPLVRSNNFGAIEIDWAENMVHVDLRLADNEGNLLETVAGQRLTPTFNISLN